MRVAEDGGVDEDEEGEAELCVGRIGDQQVVEAWWVREVCDLPGCQQRRRRLSGCWRC